MTRPPNRVPVTVSLAVLALTCVVATAAPTNIQQVDFKNFTYPFTEPSGWPHELQWLDIAEQEHVRLLNGSFQIKDEDAPQNRPFHGLTLESVIYADVTGDGRPEAIVVLRYDTGGTQYSHYVYVYGFVAGAPKLLARFHSGDRAASGLYRVYGERGRLVVELFDPEEQQGDCCSSRFVRTRFRWRRGHFQHAGKQEVGTPTTPSRLPVDAFGRHQ